MRQIVLPDILKRNLNLVFCGTAAGNRSARVGAYYAGLGNQFWAVLARVGLTPYQLQPVEFRTLPKYGIGLTDLAKTCHGPDDQIARSDFDVLAFYSKMERITPNIVAFNGKRAGKEFLGHDVLYGRQTEKLGKTTIFVLPSTSGAARRFWDESYWRKLGHFVRKSHGLSLHPVDREKL